ncbi:MAG: AAA family ATPase [Sphingomonadaceae bacterium]
MRRAIRNTVGNTGIVSLASVPMQDVSWFWKGWIPFGKLTLLGGDAGTNKSTLLIDIVARLTSGRGFPDGSPPVEPGNVLLITAEDDLGDTVVPRLRAAEADISRVTAWNAILDENSGLPRPVTFPDDAEQLRAQICEHGIRLVIVDPITAFLKRSINSWNDASFRQALTPLATVAGDTGAAMVLMAHLNKRDSGKVLYRVGGSIAQVSQARSVLLVAEHPEDRERRILQCIKSNLSEKPDPLLFCPEGVVVAGLNEKVVRVRWEGLADLDAEHALQVASPRSSGHTRQARPRRPSQMRRAIEYLVETVTPERHGAVARIKEGADERGIGWFTLQKAKESLGLESARIDGQPVWRWPETAA